MIRVRVRKVRFVGVAMAVAMLQQTLMHRYGSGYFSFDLLALTAAFMAMKAGSRDAIWSVFFLGLLRDLGSVGRLGGGALSFLPAVVLVLALKKKFDVEGFFFVVVFTFVFIAAAGLLHAAGMILLASGGTTLFFTYHAFGSALLTVVLAPPYFALLRLGGIVEELKTTF